MTSTTATARCTCTARIHRPVPPSNRVTMAELEAAIAAHQGRMLRVARRYFACEADCADAVQEALLAAVRHLWKFRGGCRLETWLYRIVVNACLMKLRAQSRQRTVPLDGMDIANEGGADPMLTGEERRRIVRQALTRLSESQRTVIQLRYFEGFTTDETAELLGIQPSAVKTRLHRSCRALGRLLRNDPRGLNDAAGI